MNSPLPRSCTCSLFEKHSVRRTNRLIWVRRLRCLLSIFCVFSFPTLVLLGLDMPLVGAPSVRIKLRDAKGFQQLLQPQEDVVLTPAEHIHQHLPRVVINGVPEPTRMRFFAHVTPGA